MKRLAILFLLAAFCPAVGAENGAMPLPTGMAAPTSPQVPVPVIVDGLPTVQGSDWSRTSFRDRLGLTTTPVPVLEEKSSPLRVWDRVTSWKPFKSSGAEHAAIGARPKWCENCAPAVRHPLPPLPEGLSTMQQASYTAPVATPCDNGGCAPAAGSKSCCQKIKDWVCYRPTPVHFPCVPTEKQPGLYTYFPTQQGPGVGCATGNCGAGGCATGKGLKQRTTGNCVACPTPAAPVMPGYRLAYPDFGAAVAAPTVENLTVPTFKTAGK